MMATVGWTSDGETNAAYMFEWIGDTDYYLRVMATYTDAVGTDMAMVQLDARPSMVGGVVDEPGMVTTCGRVLRL